MTQVESFSPRRSNGDGDASSSDAGGTGQSNGDPKDPSSPAGPEDQRRGRHATPYGQGFSWVVIWTILGALVPGSGLVAAGSRRLGAALLALVAIVGLALAYFAFLADAMSAVKLARSGAMLLIVAVVVIVVALAWVAVIFVTNNRLRRYANLTSGQRAFSTLVVLALVIGVLLPAYKLTESTLIARDVVGAVFGDEDTAGGPQTEKSDPWAGTPRVNVLLIGSDAGKGRRGVRPDTMILASIDTFVMLNLRGFAQFVNAIGGLRVNVVERLPIGGNSENPNATTGWIEKGKNQKLTGYEALWYARSRWSTDDYDRMRRQRCVIGAVVDQSNPITLARQFPSIAKAAKDNLSTGIPQKDIPAWVELSQKVQKAGVRSLAFTDEVLTSRTNPDFAKIRRLVQENLVAPPEPTAAATAPGPSPSTRPSTPTKPEATADPDAAVDVKEVC